MDVYHQLWLLGDVGIAMLLGSVVGFERDGREWRLHALPGDEDAGSLWLVFADATNGRTTYGGGRFVYTEPLQRDGRVVVDFNLAYIDRDFTAEYIGPFDPRYMVPLFQYGHELGQRGYQWKKVPPGFQ